MIKSWAGRLFLLLVLLLGGAADLGAEAGAAAPIRLAPLPMESRQAMTQSFIPLAEHLQQRLQRPVELVFLADYDELIAAFADNRVDIVFFGPLSYLQLQRLGVAVHPLVGFREADGSATYRCALTARGEDGLTPADLRGAVIALTQPRSTCGYLGTNAILREQAGFSLEETDYHYLGSHDQVALAVAAGQAVAGGVKESYALKYRSLDLAIIGRSGWLPPFVLAANPNTLAAATIDELSMILLQTDAETYRRWGPHLRHGMVVVSDADYDILRVYGNPEQIPPPRAEREPAGP